MIYQRIVDNALWGYVQPKGGWTAYSTKLQGAERETTSRRVKSPVELGDQGQDTVLPTKYDADYRALDKSDTLQCLVNDLDSDMFTTEDPDALELIPVFGDGPSWIICVSVDKVR